MSNELTEQGDGRSQLPKPKHNTNIFVFSYSGIMLTEGGFDQVEVQYDDYKVLLFPPKRLADPTWRPIPQFRQENIKRVFENAPSIPLHRLAIFPSVDENGKPALKQVWGDETDVSEYKDTFTIAATGLEPDGEALGLCEELLERAFRWLRTLSKQWWIGRPSEALNGNMHFVVNAMRNGTNLQIESSPILHGRGTTPPDGISKVGKGLWKICVEKASAREEPPVDLILEGDLHYFYGLRQRITLTIVICSLFEVLRDEALDRANLSISDLRSGSTDLLRHVSVGFQRVFERNMLNERPDAFEFLKSCWIERGHVAHGKQVDWKYRGRTEKWFGNDHSKSLRRLKVGIDWMREVRDSV